MSATLHLITDRGPACGRAQGSRVALTVGPDDLTGTPFDLALCPQCLDVVEMLEDRNRARYIARKDWELRTGRKAGTAGVHVPRSQPSGPARNDPMPVLLVVGLAVLCLFAVFGFISIGQMLQRIAGG